MQKSKLKTATQESKMVGAAGASALLIFDF
jgi:hypothetical protein